MKKGGLLGLILFSFILVVMFAIDGSAQDHLANVTNLNYTINVSGAYRFNASYNISSTTANGIVLNVNHVDINCMGFRMAGFGGNTGFGIYLGINSTYTNVTVRNCTIINFSINVFANNVTNLTLLNNTIINTTIGSGVFFRNVSNSVLNLNNITDNALDGVTLTASTNVTMTNNEVLDNLNHGFNLSVGSNNNTITTNIATNNTADGFFIDASESNILTTNTIFGNVDGIQLSSSSDYNTFTSNQLRNNTAFGIYIDDTTSEYNTFTSNNLTNIGVWEINLGANDNYFYYDIVGTEGGSYQTNFSFNQYAGPLNFSGNATPTAGEGSLRNITRFLSIAGVTNTAWVLLNFSYITADLTNSGISETSLLIYRYNETSATWENLTTTRDITNNNIYSNITQFSEFAPLGSVACGNITTNAILTQDLNSTGSCIMLNASNIIFDCRGHTIRGNGTTQANGAIGVNLTAGHNNITLRNCRIWNYTDGVYTNWGNGSSIEDNVVYSNRDNLEMAGTNSTTVINNTFYLAGISDINLVTKLNSTVFYTNVLGRTTDYPTTISFAKYNSSLNMTAFTPTQYAATTANTASKVLPRFLNITNTDGNYLELNITYTAADVEAGAALDTSLVMYHYNTTSAAWETITSQVVTASRYVFANVSVFSPFGLGGDTNPSGSGGGSSSGGGGAGSTSSLTNLDVVQKFTRVVMVNQEVNFINKAEVHALTVKNIDTVNKKATVEISSTPKTYILTEGQRIEVDTDGNGIKDMSLTFDKLVLTSAQLTFEKIDEMQPAVSGPLPPKTTAGEPGAKEPTPTPREQIQYIPEPAKDNTLIWTIVGIIAVIIFIWILVKVSEKKGKKRRR